MTEDELTENQCSDQPAQTAEETSEQEGGKEEELVDVESLQEMVVEDSIEGGQQEGETDKMTSEDQSGLVMLSLHTPYCIVACGIVLRESEQYVCTPHPTPPKPSMQNGGGSYKVIQEVSCIYVTGFGKTRHFPDLLILC